MAYLLGIDLGTSSVKAILIDGEGHFKAKSFREYPLYQEKNGWAEQEPWDWWQASCAAISSLIHSAGIKPSAIKGVGISGQMHGAVLLNGQNQILRRAIIWCDQRSVKECTQITDLIGRERLLQLTANPALTGFTASKVLWIKNNERAVFEKITKILLPKDYLRFKLTGEFATDVSDASGMQFMDVPHRAWSEEIINKLGFAKEMFPRLYESPEVTGKITAEASQLTGLVEGTPVVAGAGDQAAGAVGNGIVKEGLVSSTIGTSGVVFAHTDKLLIDPLGRVHSFCHAVPHKYHIMGVTQGAGLSLKWLRDSVFSDIQKEAERLQLDAYDFLAAQAEGSSLGANGLIFLPYLMGERTPHADPFARGVFLGLSPKHRRADIIRAVMEGVVFSLKDCLGIIEELKLPIKKVRASGGGAKSSLWRKLQADIFAKEIWTVECGEGPALGAAILAGVGTGVYGSVEEGCKIVVKAHKTDEPDLSAHRAYQPYYELYRKLYPLLKDVFKELGGLHG